LGKTVRLRDKELGDEHWRAVAIGSDGWRVLGCPPVRFRRSPGMLPLPVPEARRIDRRTAVVPQSFEPGRLCVGRRMVAGRRCDQAVPFRCSQYPASRARRKILVN
jgi:hypothetical protein